MNKVLTISIAAFNAQNTIKDTLDSLIVPEIMDKLEIFVVDDGGTDETLSIAKEYAMKYPNSIFPVHKENGGYGSVQNYVINHATGIYFKTLDGDDMLEKGALGAFLKQLENENADVIISDMRSFCENNIDMKKIETFDISDLQNIAINVPSSHYGHQNITYRTEVLLKSGVELPEHLLYTDTVYFYLPFLVATTIRYYHINMYNYRIGRDGQSVSTESIKKHIDDLLKISLMISENYHLISKNTPNKSYLLRVCGITGRTAFRYLYRCGINKATLQKLRKFDTEMKEISPEIYTVIEGKDFGNSGILIKSMRRTRYLAFWLLKLVPWYTNRCD